MWDILSPVSEIAVFVIHDKFTHQRIGILSFHIKNNFASPHRYHILPKNPIFAPCYALATKMLGTRFTVHALNITVCFFVY